MAWRVPILWKLNYLLFVVEHMRRASDGLAAVRNGRKIHRRAFLKQAGAQQIRKMRTKGEYKETTKCFSWSAEALNSHYWWCRAVSIWTPILPLRDETGFWILIESEAYKGSCIWDFIQTKSFILTEKHEKVANNIIERVSRFLAARAEKVYFLNI